MKHLSASPRFQWFDEDGFPAFEYLLYTYAAGSTTPLPTYTDSTGGTENTNPIELDSFGSADIWLTNVQYKFVLKTPAGATVWTVDNIASTYIYGDDITWTGTHIFNGPVTFNEDVNGNITFTGSITVDNDLYVTGDFAVDGDVSFNGTLTVAELICPLITLGSAGAIADLSGVIGISTATHVLITTDVGGTPRTFDFREDGALRLPVDGVDDLDAATVGQTAAALLAAVTPGMIPVAIGAVVSNALVSGSIGVASVSHPSPATYTITLSAATTSEAKTIVFATPRYPSPLRNYSAFAVVNTTTEIGVTTGGGNTWVAQDLDFNFVVYSLP